MKQGENINLLGLKKRLGELFYKKEWIILFTAVLLLLIFIPNGTKQTKKDTDYTLLSDAAEVSPINVERLEEELESILSCIEGIGETKVMIQAKEVDENYAKVVGILVVAQGSKKGRVDMDILNSVQALFDIPAHKVVIMKMK